MVSTNAAAQAEWSPSRLGMTYLRSAGVSLACHQSAFTSALISSNLARIPAANFQLPSGRMNNLHIWPPRLPRHSLDEVEQQISRIVLDARSLLSAAVALAHCAPARQQTTAPTTQTTTATR